MTTDINPFLATTQVTEVTLPPETLKAFGGDELRARTFFEKYALRDERGERVESLPQQMWQRVAHEIASVEKTPELRKEWEEKFYWLLEDYRFIPGGRILFGAGQPRQATLLNCYVLESPEDSLENIFETAKEMARTYSFGGGCGIDISRLRPKGSPVNNSAIFSTGSTSFMNLYSMTTEIIGQAGRRGALMITISVEHPDVLDFIDIKKDLKNVTHANISVRITDGFMKAVEADKEFMLHFENDKVKMSNIVKARAVWNKLVEAAWQSAEPGVLFWDTTIRNSTSNYDEMTPISTNPCSEIGLPANDCCCLGSICLNKFVKNPFTKDAIVDTDNLVKMAEYATRFLDDVLDYNAEKHPLPAQKMASLKGRRIGVGITGLADMLIKLSIKYDTDKAIGLVEETMKFLKETIYDYSITLAEEKGIFPAYDPIKHMNQPFIKALPTEIRERMSMWGIRNVAIQTVPPVGSGSILVGTSSGIEPVFAFTYKRRSKSLSQSEFRVIHPILQEYKDAGGDPNNLPDYFVASHQIKPEFRVKMQAAIQKHIDQSISSTVNLPQDISVDEVAKIYMLAYKSGCKGITVYREGSREGILETDNIKKGPKLDEHGEFERPQMMEGKTIKFKTQEGGFYLTANNGTGTIKEVFVEIGKAGSSTKADAEALGRLISLYLQSGGDAQNVIRALKGIKGPSVSWDAGMKIESIPDAVAKALEILTKKDATTTEGLADIRKEQGANQGVSEPLLEICPECHVPALVNEGGCATCRNCSFSRC